MAKTIIRQSGSDVVTVVRNTSRTEIVITADKLRIILDENLDGVNVGDRDAWVGPVGMIVTIVVTLTTSQFKTFGKLTPDMMTGLAIGGILGCVVWLVFAIKRISRKTSKTISANIMRQAQDEQNVRISGTLAGRSTLAGALTVERGEPK
jgi:hypothetical protein